MTDGTTSHSDSTIVAQLTAYLDGELEASEVRDVEERISSDQRYQKLLHQLQQSWDVLDVLPPVEISAARDFTQSTMKLAIQDARRLTEQKNTRFWTWPLRVLALCLVPCVASAATFFTHRYVQNIPVHQLQQNLSVIRNLDAYTYDKKLTVDFLERLGQKGDLFGVTVRTLPTMTAEMALSDDQLLSQFDSLSEIQKQRIRDNFRRFQRLSPSEKKRIAELHQQVTDHENSSTLMLTLRRYYRWLRTLGETETATILDAVDTSTKIKLIEDLTWEKFDNEFGTGLMGLPEKDRMSIYLGLLNIVSDQHRQNRMEAEFLEKGMFVELMEIENDARKLFDDDSEERKIFLNGRRLKLLYETDPDKIDQLITVDDVNRLRPLLSAEAREIMNETINWPGNFDKSEAQLLVQWMIQEFDSRFSRPDAPKTIQEVYRSLTSQERDRIDNEHPADRQKLLLEKLKEMSKY